MINITDINKDDIITLEEANEILAYAKRIYPGQLSGITIKEGRPFAFYHEPGKKWYITIPEYIDDNTNLNGKTIIVKEFKQE